MVLKPDPDAALGRLQETCQRGTLGHGGETVGLMKGVLQHRLFGTTEPPSRPTCRDALRHLPFGWYTHRTNPMMVDDESNPLSNGTGWRYQNDASRAPKNTMDHDRLRVSPPALGRATSDARVPVYSHESSVAWEEASRVDPIRSVPCPILFAGGVSAVGVQRRKNARGDST